MMKVSARERKLLLAAGLAVSALTLYAAFINRSGPVAVAASAKDGSIAGLHAEVLRRHDLKLQLSGLNDRLKTKDSDKTFDEQAQGFVKALEDVGGQNNIKFTSFNPRQQSTRAKIAAGSVQQYEIKFGASHGSLVKFIQAIEASGVPVSVESLHIKGNPQPDSLEVAMVLSFYYLEPMKSETPA